jgi:hypothetical protein
MWPSIARRSLKSKPSIQALERAQGYLKLPNGRALTDQSHDYKWHTTTPDRELHVILDEPALALFMGVEARVVNQVETWFSILQGQSLSGASLTSVEELQEHIDAFIAATAMPFAWTTKRIYQAQKLSDEQWERIELIY